MGIKTINCSICLKLGCLFGYCLLFVTVCKGIKYSENILRNQHWTFLGTRSTIRLGFWVKVDHTLFWWYDIFCVIYGIFFRLKQLFEVFYILKTNFVQICSNESISNLKFQCNVVSSAPAVTAQRPWHPFSRIYFPTDDPNGVRFNFTFDYSLLQFITAVYTVCTVVFMQFWLKYIVRFGCFCHFRKRHLWAMSCFITVRFAVSRRTK